MTKVDYRCAYCSAEIAAKGGRAVQCFRSHHEMHSACPGDQALRMTSSIVQAKEILPYVTEKLGSSQICTGKSDTEFELVIQLNDLSSLQANALGLSGVTALCMHVRLQSAIYYGGYHRPVVEFRVLAQSKSYSEPYGAILSQITKMSEDFFADNWPCHTTKDTLEFLPGLYRHVQARLPLLGCFCVVCGNQQEHLGLKILPCKSPACMGMFNEHGFRADLSDIYSRPVLADLLITMASAGCQCINRRDSLFQSMPSDMFSKGQGSIDQQKSLYASEGIVSQQMNWQRMQEAFQSLPSVAAMATEPNLQDFFDRNHLQRGLPTFQFLRWVLNSCQGHLMQLQEEEDKFPMMATQYQFRLATDRPPKEFKFSRLKEKHGSRFMFHGSPFYNWHSILQDGLKHAGLAGYGDLASNRLYQCAGIYLAEDSGYSAGYCHYRDHGGFPAYPNSIFGQKPLCIALCEVINECSSSRAEAGVRIEMDANKVIARYLFVFPSNDSNKGSPNPAIPSVQAASLYEICEKHGKEQAIVLDAVKKALQDSQQHSQMRYVLLMLQMSILVYIHYIYPEFDLYIHWDSWAWHLWCAQLCPCLQILQTISFQPNLDLRWQ